jgi:hypothetical protein
MLLKGALHVHTTCSDGELTIAETVWVYADLGFDFIALTDHDYLLRGDCYKDIHRLESGLMIFNGVEVTVFEKGYVHVGRIHGDRDTLHIFNHPGELDQPLDKVIERIAGVAARIPLDAVEITTKGFPTMQYDIPEIPYPKVATDDAHTLAMCGRAWVEMECRRDKDAIIRAIRAGDFWNCYA